MKNCGNSFIDPVKSVGKIKKTPKYSMIYGGFLQCVPGPSPYRHFEYREDLGDEVRKN